MHPVLITFNFSFINGEIKAYPFFLILGGITVFFGSLFYAKRRKFTIQKVFITLSAMLAGALIGARLFFVYLNFGTFVSKPSLIFVVDATGLSLYGGIICAALIGVISCRIFNINFWKLGDTIAPFLGIGIAILRIGCFLNGCCFGKETKLLWGVTFPLFSPAHKFQMAHDPMGLFAVAPVHPTEIYELIAAIIGSILAYYILKKNVSNGIAVLVFGIWFTAFRWFNYYLMVRMPTFSASPNFYPLLYFAVISTGLVLLNIKLRFVKLIKFLF